MSLIWINGQWHDRDTAKISVYDHGLLYGDGVFEGMRVYGGKPFRMDEHIGRLYDSAKAIWLVVPIPVEEMARVTVEGVTRAGISEGYLRHIVTRGMGDLGLDPRGCPHPTVIIIFDTIRIWPAERYEKGLAMIGSATPMPNREALSPRVKSLNYLPHIMAKLEGIHAQMDEVLMLDRSGYVAEASGMNIFLVRRGVVTTPPVWTGILRGVTRDIVIELATEAGVPVREEPINRYDVYTADEAFLTGTAAEIAPIRSLDGRQIGAGPIGPVTRTLMDRFRELTRG
ncbi:MAG: branched-chain-amino-acid transaminase [Gemmatimonadales bacterium]|jgi:branched-chain amino acid aminotransferase|nr:MAG: branched-chain-amino-acid transaminase [Gemmatimonadales bacterium]